MRRRFLNLIVCSVALVGTIHAAPVEVVVSSPTVAQSVNGKSGVVNLVASDVGAMAAVTEQTVSATGGTATIAAPTNGGNVVRVRLNATLTSALTLTLPAASAVREVRVEDEGNYSSATNTVSVIRAGSDTVTGLTTAVPALAGYGTQTFVSDLSSKWALFNNTNNQAITPTSVTAGTVKVGTTGTTVKNIRYVTATLSGGTIAVSDTAILATSQIYPSNYTSTGTPGAVFVASKTAGTGYTVTSTNSGATNQVSVMIVDF